MTRDFSGHIFSTILTSGEKGNCILSPNSIFTLFTSVKAGQDPNAQIMINHLLGYQDEQPAKTFDLFNSKLKKQTKFFLRCELPLPENDLLHNLGCDLEEINPQKVEELNSIGENTGDFPKKYFKPSSLNNSISLDLEWSKDLGRRTSKKSFHSKSAQVTDVEYVDFSGCNYADMEDFRIMEVPSGNEHLKVLCFIPNTSNDIDRIHRWLDRFSSTEYLSNMKQCPGNISIPKFKMDQEINLRNFLSESSYKFCHYYSTGEMKTATSIDFSEKGFLATAYSGCELILGPVITELIYETEIANRFAKTLITSKVENLETILQETTFSVLLPENAFISKFVMEIDGKFYESQIKEKEEAKEIYEEAVARGRSAAQVAVSARDSNVFTVSVNVQPKSEMRFFLTYEELLQRRFDQYEYVLNFQPLQLVKLINFSVNIKENRKLKFVKTPEIRTGTDCILNEEQNLLSSINISDSMAVIKFHPSVDDQKKMLNKLKTREFKGQFVIQYDVELDPSNGEVLISDGYFVHFYTPDDLPPLPKHVVFTLDTSGSMCGRKIEQLIDAMTCILDQIKQVDIIDISEFTNDVTVYNIDTNSSIVINDMFLELDYEDPFPMYRGLCLPKATPASKDIITKAKSLVNNLTAKCSTHLIGGLQTALFLVNRGQEQFSEHQPLIIFLTDGQPTDGISDTNLIVQVVSKINQKNNKAPIFSLSFGEDADKNFMRKLSLNNFGFSRHIYEASDASLQLQKFYQQISSPLLSNVSFKYNCNIEDVTRTDFPIYFRGSDIVICGRHASSEVISSVNLYRQGELIELKPVIKNSSSQIERLWAYLTIKQLLEQREMTEDKNELTKKALELALKYSFVTEVTSLVVVKPDEAPTNVNTENIVELCDSENDDMGCSKITLRKLKKKKAIHNIKLKEPEELPIEVNVNDVLPMTGRKKKRIIKTKAPRIKDEIQIVEELKNSPKEFQLSNEPENNEAKTDFVVDSPFVMMVLLKLSDEYVTLFMGRITQPEY